MGAGVKMLKGEWECTAPKQALKVVGARMCAAKAGRECSRLAGPPNMVRVRCQDVAVWLDQALVVQPVARQDKL